MRGTSQQTVRLHHNRPIVRRLLVRLLLIPASLSVSRARQTNDRDLERRLDELCDQYLKHPHTKEMQREIIDLAKRLDELKKEATTGKK